MHPGHLNETESLFNYSLDGNTYSTINNGYQTYRPLFTDDLNVTDDVIAMCRGLPECIYDYTVTGSVEIGLATVGTVMNNNDVAMTLSK